MNMVFVDSGNGAGSFTFDPDFFQADTYHVTFVARDIIGAEDSEVVEIVVTNVNRSPVLDPIGSKTVMEGETLEFRIHAADADLDSVILGALDVPLNAEFVDSGNGAGSFVFNPNFTQADTYHVTFVAEDTMEGADSEVVEIAVTEAGNQPPSLYPLADSLNVAAGDTLILHVWATDPDDPSITLSTDILPTNSDFYDSGNGGGLFTFYPDYPQADSIYHVNFIASDGLLSDSEMVAMRIVSYVPGDANGDGVVDAGDVIVLVNYLFLGASLPYLANAADPNGDCGIDVGDIIYLNNYLYLGGSEPRYGCVERKE